MENNAVITKETLKLGQFQVISGQLRVTDPSYKATEWYNHLLSNVKCGTWNAEITSVCRGRWGEKVQKLRIVHADAPQEIICQTPTTFAVGADSEQVGFFDAAHFGDNTVFPADLQYRWYAFCCDMTAEEPHAGIIPFGVVSTSGFGNGIFGCEYAMQDDVIVAIELLFFDDSEI